MPKKKQTDPLDRNKSPLTHKITALASGHIAILGCKPVETEVPIKNFGIADVASFTYPTQTELKNAKLLKILAPDKIRDSVRYQYFFTQYGDLLTVLVEVKVTKQDLKKDIKTKFGLMPAHLCYLAYPKSLENEVDNIDKKIRNFKYHWGRLICSDNGKRILKATPPLRISAQHPGDIIDFIAKVAIRRDHRTNYRWLRDMMKSYRAKNA